MHEASNYNAESRTVTLKSGGLITISTTVQVFTLSKEDRDFVMGFVDQLSEYEKKVFEALAHTAPETGTK